jgi:hypothetical protein
MSWWSNGTVLLKVIVQMQSLWYFLSYLNCFLNKCSAIMYGFYFYRWIQWNSAFMAVKLHWKMFLKGQSNEIFDPRFFSLNCTPGSPDSCAKTILHIDSNSRRYLIKFDDENRNPAMLHSAEFFRIAGSQNKTLSAFTEAVKVTVFQKICHRWSCLPHGSKIKF